MNNAGEGAGTLIIPTGGELMTGSINGGTQKTREGKESSSANRNKPVKKGTSRNKRSGAFTKITHITSIGSEGSLSSLGSVTEN